MFRSGKFDNYTASIPSWVIAASIFVVVVSFTIGVIVGILPTRFCGIFVQGIRHSKSIDNPTD